MIRVCHVQVLPILSGAQRSMLEIIRHLDRSRYDVHVACKEAGPLTEELGRHGVTVHLVPELERPVRPWRDYQAYRQLRRLFEHEQFDIVHTHSSKPGFVGRLAARRAGVPVVIHHVRGFAFHEFSSRPTRWLYSLLEQFAADFCDRIVFVNREERDFVARRGWLPAEHCLTIYNGVDLAAVNPTHCPRFRSLHRAAWGANDNEMLILFMGRLEDQKQPLLLIEIARELEKLRPGMPWRICVAGSGPLGERLSNAVRDHSLMHRVDLLGWQRDPHGVLHAADVMLLPSLFEGLPRTLIEAQAAGLPIVASDVKGNREVVTAGTGYLCSAKDPIGYARALAHLVENAALRRAMGAAARRHAEQCFDTVAVNQSIVDVYESLVAA